jgi:hypothetical protein
MKAKKLVSGVLIVLALLAVGLIDAHYGFALPALVSLFGSDFGRCYHF